MTAKQRLKYSRNAIRMQKALEKQFVGPVYRAIVKQVSSFFIDTNDIEVVKNRIQLSLFNEALVPVVTRLHKVAGLANATKVRRELRLEEKKSFGTNEELLALILDFLRTRGLEFATTINNTTKLIVLKLIDEGVANNLSFREIADSIRGNVQFKYQAIRIVRTEIVRATNAGAVAAAETSPFEVIKEWISAHDNRVRHSHRELDGQRREMDEDFKPNLAQPGDPRAEAKEVIQCRCTLAIVAKRDENGRLIRKINTTPSPIRQAA